MVDHLFIASGPAFAALALLLFFIPKCRPVALRRAIWILACCMSVPTLVGLAIHSSDLVVMAYLVKPVFAVAGAALFIGTLILWKSSAVRFANSLPVLAILMASLADAATLHRFADTWGGAQC